MSDSITSGQDVRFNSTLSWAWWPFIQNNEAECIDGVTGFARCFEPANNQPNSTAVMSMVSTESLLSLFCDISASMFMCRLRESKTADKVLSLTELRAFKRHTSPEYEAAKDVLMARHRLFRQWRRRENEGKN